ncbi:penicillin acylase family protein [Streptomyces sp. NPDC052040]|uniref:penicillin acylase family protein n=1 Tax=Streptomyces sp. NPDC052040 TaxID=3365682 RepID=UPI0037D0C472
MTTETYRDAWGIPHLRADDALSLARAQGRVTALDRAWQLEVERHRAQGTSAAFLGPGSLPWDLLARRARVEDSARRCLAALERQDPETADWVRAYTEGVNEGLAEGARRSPEFARTGLAPGRWEPWHPLGVWLATHLLFAGFPAKFWREEVVRHLGEDAVGLFAADGPGILGSNGWLADGSRTATGQALIAGDPHRFIEEPGVYQQIRLACPEFDVVGLAVPGVPGTAHFAHAGPVAWAITNAMADYQDLYHERLRRTADGGVEALDPDGQWRAVSRHLETVEVAGAEPVEVEVIETPRGPVVSGGPRPAAGTPVGPPQDQTPTGPTGERTPVGPTREQTPTGPTGDQTPVGPTGEQTPADPTREQTFTDDTGTATPGFPPALSLRYPARVTADLGFGALLPLLRARSVDEVDRALDRWAEPVNVVLAADVHGGVLHRVAGTVPLRAEANRTRPVPAWEPGHEWRGWQPMPRGTTEGGFAVMANQRGLAAPLGVEFAPAHRADRIRTLLDGGDVWSAPDMAAVHMDTRLASAAPLLERLAALDALTPAADALRDRLLRWDRHMDADSADAAVYAAVRDQVVRRLAAQPAFAPLITPTAHPDVFRPWLVLTARIGYALEHLLRAEELFGIDRDAVLREAVEETAAHPPQGTWGDTHRLAPWRALEDPEGEERDEEPGLSGDHDCVLCASAVPGLTHLSARAPAARYIWDLARREDSLWVVPLGASGVPGSAHHRDQLPLWLEGELAPVVTGWELLTKESTHDH